MFFMVITIKALQTVLNVSLSVPTYTTKNEHKRQHSLLIGSLQLHLLRHLSQVPEDMTGTSGHSDSIGNVGVTLFFKDPLLICSGRGFTPDTIEKRNFSVVLFLVDSLKDALFFKLWILSFRWM